MTLEEAKLQSKDGYHFPRVDRTCKHCGRNFKVLFHVARRGLGIYCSTACGNAAKSEANLGRTRNRVKATCQGCGKEFERQAYRVKRDGQKYCSRACVKPRPKMAPLLATCVICGKQYETKRCYEGKTKCCSYDCLHVHIGRSVSGKNHPRWKGGITSRPHAVRMWSLAIKRRDGYKCQDCGETDRRKLQSHHIIPWDDNESLRFDLHNGVTLCLSCHQLRHPNLAFIERQEVQSGKIETPQRLFVW